MKISYSPSADVLLIRLREEKPSDSRETLADPDHVRRSIRFSSARLFSRWYSDLRSGKHVVVVVVSDLANGRHWIITAYIATRLIEGETEWKRN